MKKEKVLAGIVLGGVGLGLLTIFMVAGILIKAFVLVKLWGWFIVPYFGWSALSYPLAVGLATIIGFTTHQLPMRHDFVDDKVETKHNMIYTLTCLLWPLLTLLVGWVASLWM